MTALMGISTRLRLARLVFVAPTGPGLGALVGQVVAAGADAVQVKGARLSDAEATAALDTVRRVTRGRQPLLMLQGPARRADAAGADALLLPDDAADAAAARAVVSQWAVIGRACNSADEVDAALADDAVDFLVVGPGLDHIRHAATVAPPWLVASKPWFAAGGITERTLDVVLRAGALRVVVGRGISGASEPGAVASAMATTLREAWAADSRMDAVVDAAFGDRPVGELSPGADPAPTDLRMD